MIDLKVFLEKMEAELNEAQYRIIKENQECFTNIVLSNLQKGDVLFVANGTSLLKRNGTDNTENEELDELCEDINWGVWRIGFEFEYKTEVE